MGKSLKNNSEMDNTELEPTLENNSADTPSASQNQEQKKLNEIRNLLFGQNVQEYRSEFEELKAIIQENKSQSEQAAADLQRDILDRLDKLENKLSDSIESTNQSLSKRLNDLDDSKADRKAIASILHQLASQLEA